MPSRSTIQSTQGTLVGTGNLLNPYARELTSLDVVLLLVPGSFVFHFRFNRERRNFVKNVDFTRC